MVLCYNNNIPSGYCHCTVLGIICPRYTAPLVSIAFRVRIMLVPSLWKHPPMSGVTKFLNPPFAGFSQAFPALETPLNPKHCSMLLVPIFYFITPFFKFLRRSQREIRKKNHPLFKDNFRVKSQIPPFFTILGPDFEIFAFSHSKTGLFLSILCWYFLYFVGTNDMFVGFTCTGKTPT